MISLDRRCSECGETMIIDHVTEKDGVKKYWYACINPNCVEKGKAYSTSGEESDGQVKPKTE